MEGDLWDLLAQHHRIVVTTNIGWSVPGKINNMGAGIALQAKLRIPKLPRWYGLTCAWLREQTPVLAYPKDPRIILFPVKPLLDPDNPEISWNQLASFELIEQGLHQLRALPGQIALSTPGAGNGKLPEAEVAELVRRVLGADPNPRRFVLVKWHQPDRQRVPVRCEVHGEIGSFDAPVEARGLLLRTICRQCGLPAIAHAAAAL